MCVFRVNIVHANIDTYMYACVCTGHIYFYMILYLYIYIETVRLVVTQHGVSCN